MRRLICFVTVLLALFTASACAQQAAPTVKSVETVLGENASLIYPQLEGLKDEAVQQKINDGIVLDAEITSYFSVLTRQNENSFGLHIGYTASLMPTLLSVHISAKGEMPNGREDNREYMLCYDLDTGERVPFSALVKDEQAAIAHMEDKLNQTLYDELSGYMGAANLTPLPSDCFYLDETGITFAYDSSQFSYVSGYAGQVQFGYDELWDVLDLSKDGLLARNGIVKPDYTDKEIKSQIEQTLEKGMLPNIPAAIGEPMKELVAKYRLLRDPDLQPGSRVYQMEAPQFRATQVLTGTLGKGYEDALIEGVQTTRCSLYGLVTGEATMDRCRAVLGEPESVVPFTEPMAYDYALPLGTAAYYRMGDYQLRLYFDQDSILYSVMLTQ